MFYGVMLILSGLNSLAYYWILSILNKNALLSRASRSLSYLKTSFLLLGTGYALSTLKNDEIGMNSLQNSGYSSGESWLFQIALSLFWILFCILIASVISDICVYGVDRLWHQAVLWWLKKTGGHLGVPSGGVHYPTTGIPPKTMNIGYGKTHTSPSMAAQEAIAKMEKEKKQRA